MAMGHLDWKARYSFGVGHVLNDLTAAMWFTYLLVFYHAVLGISNVNAGLIMLIGQVADACFTPFIGLASDRTTVSYGPRKTWHLLGTICVVLSFSFIFHDCISCESPSEWAIRLYYCCFVVVFQFGWASVQISHLSLIPELTSDRQEQVTLNGIRYAFTIISTVFVYLAMWVLLDTVGKNSKDLGRNDLEVFEIMAYTALGVGLIFTSVFHLGTKEKPVEAIKDEPAFQKRSDWRKWFRRAGFYQTGLIYMASRLMVNISQVYTPLYILHTLHMTKHHIAIFPLVVYVSSFVTTLGVSRVHKTIGARVTYLLGLVFFFAACVWMNLQKGKYDCVKGLTPSNATILPSMLPVSPCPEGTEYSPNHDAHVESIFGAAVLLGAGGATVLVTSLSMVAHLIGRETDSGAFVYGAMSFCDKLSNGATIQIIQVLHPCSLTLCCPSCSPYYRMVVSFIPGGAAAFGLLVLFLMVMSEKLRIWCSMPGCLRGNVQDETAPIDIHYKHNSDYGSMS